MGVEILARELFRHRAATRVIAVQLPICASRADDRHHHLCPLPGPGPGEPAGLGGHACRPGGGQRARHRRSACRPREDLFATVADALGVGKVVVLAADEDSRAAEREQWDDANNFLAVAPGVVIGYERNTVTNRMLEEHGIKVAADPGQRARPGSGRVAVHDLPDPARRDLTSDGICACPGSLLKELDLDRKEVLAVLDLARGLKSAKASGTEQRRLVGRNIALIFEKASTRTRCAFEVAAYDQGAHVTYLGPEGSHIGGSESIADTARVLGRMFDGIELRGFAQASVEQLADYAGVPVWNGLTTEWHPTQMLADILTMTEHYDGSLEQIAYSCAHAPAHRYRHGVRGLRKRIVQSQRCHRPPGRRRAGDRASTARSGAAHTRHTGGTEIAAPDRMATIAVHAFRRGVLRTSRLLGALLMTTTQVASTPAPARLAGVTIAPGLPRCRCRARPVGLARLIVPLDLVEGQCTARLELALVAGLVPVGGDDPDARGVGHGQRGGYGEHVTAS